MELNKTHKEYEVIRKLIEYFNIKLVGTYRAVLLGDYDYSEANDIDFIVRQDTIKRVISFLKDEGFTTPDKPTVERDIRYNQLNTYKCTKEDYKSIHLIVSNEEPKEYKSWLVTLVIENTKKSNEKLLHILQNRLNKYKK